MSRYQDSSSGSKSSGVSITNTNGVLLNKINGIDSRLETLEKKYRAKIKEVETESLKYKGKIEESELKFDNKINHFYTVFGILFAVFAIGGFAGSNYLTSELFSLWTLALGAVSFYVFISEFRKYINNKKENITWKDKIIDAIPWFSLFCLTGILISGSIGILWSSLNKSSQNQEEFNKKVSDDSQDIKTLQENINVLNNSVGELSSRFSDMKLDQRELLKRK